MEIWRFEKHIALSEKKPPLADGEVHGLSSENRILIEGSKRAKRRRETKWAFFNYVDKTR